MEFMRNVNGKLLRCGITTGTCAAAAAKAAGIMLLCGNSVEQVTIDTPKGVTLTLDVLDIRIVDGCASCAIRKDSGDDPDVTDGALLYAQVQRNVHGIQIDGAQGVGRVTRPGLDQPVGADQQRAT
ncbi:MAG: cobalt-precorrin-5B (C(1))-methyltransferase [Oscillospiraceae bacterium]